MAKHILRSTRFWLFLFLIGCSATPLRPDADSQDTGFAPSSTPQEEHREEKKVVVIDKDAKKAFDKAVALYQRQKKSGRFDYDQLLSAFKAVLDEDSKMAEAHYNLGCIYEAMREDSKAQEHYEEALSIRPDLTLAAANWGALLARNGDLDKALAIYERGLSKDAKNSAVLLNMASIYQQQKRNDLALKRASEVLVRDPTNIGAYRVMASVYYGMGELDMARLICLRGLQVKQDDPSLLNTLGLVLLGLKKVPEALVQFRLALKMRPDMLPTRFNIAKIALDYKDFRVAKEQFEKIVQFEPKNRQASIGLAIALRGMGDFDKARAKFTELAKKYDKDPIPRQWLCRLALRNFNDSKLAKTECGRCIELLSGNPPDNHPCVSMLNEAVQGLKMEVKMKEMEARALEEQKELEAKLARLAEMRKKIVDAAWEKAKKNCEVMPPKKLDGEKMEFVLNPLAVEPTKKTNVRLVGALFENVKRINVGQIKVRWRQLNEHTLEIVVPKGLEEGPWDILITNKDGSELFFQGGLWVGKKPTCKPAPTKEKSKEKSGNKAPAAAKPATQPESKK